MGTFRPSYERQLKMVNIIILGVAVLVSSLTFPDQANAGGADPTCGKKIADIIFVVDESGSIRPDEFKQQIEFVTKVTDLFDIGKHLTRVGLVMFSTKPRTVFGVDKYGDKASIKKGVTMTDKALDHVAGMVKTSRRKGVPLIILLLTDGFSTKPELTINAADKAHGIGVQIMAIGIGKTMTSDKAKSELEKIAGNQEDVLQVTSFKELSKISQKVAAKTCHVVENEALKIKDNEVIIKYSDISKAMEKYAIHVAKEAQEMALQVEIAKYIAAEMEKKFKGHWGCVVGQNYGAQMYHLKNHYIFFLLGEQYILLFKYHC